MRLKAPDIWVDFPVEKVKETKEAGHGGKVWGLWNGEKKSWIYPSEQPLMKQEAPDCREQCEKDAANAPDLGEGQGTRKCTGWGQLGAYLGIWHCIPSKSIKRQHRVGGKRQQVSNLASMGRSCPLPAQMHFEPTGRMLPAAHKVAVAPWLWAGQTSRALSRWILIPLHRRKSQTY